MEYRVPVRKKLAKNRTVSIYSKCCSNSNCNSIQHQQQHLAVVGAADQRETPPPSKGGRRSGGG